MAQGKAPTAAQRKAAEAEAKAEQAAAEEARGAVSPDDVLTVEIDVDASKAIAAIEEVRQSLADLEIAAIRAKEQLAGANNEAAKLRPEMVQ